MKRSFISTFIVLFSMAAISLYPCTIFNASKGGRVLAGNNEDLASTNSKVWFIPAAEGKYGYFLIGFTDYGTQGGMNDQGLFYDWNALKFSQMKPSPDKKSPKGVRLMPKIMEECATVQDVLDLFDQFDLGFWGNYQLHLADRKGDSAVIGADKNGELFVARKEKDYFVSTNFNLANPEFGAFSYPCTRYNIATEMLESMKELTVDLFRSILSAAHQEAASPTTYSNICDLTSGDIYVYNFHNFEEVVKFNLEEELKKGKHDYDFSSLFSRKTHAQINFENTLKRKLAQILMDTIVKEGWDAAVVKFDEMKESYSPIPGELDRLGILLRIRGRTKERIKVYKLYTKEYPKIAYGHKRLGDLYFKFGKKEEAIRCYKTVLKLDPNNAEVIHILKDLEK